MPRQRPSNDKNVSKKPILQDFSITSLSEISSGVLNPSDSTIYEEIKGYDVALPNATLNNTEDIDLFSGPYPPDSTMMVFSKGTTPTPSQVFKKPFFNRHKAKPRQSLFDLDGEEFSQDTPEPKIHHPFKRKSKKTLNSTVFDLESSNENINTSNDISNFITRRTLRGKRNVDNSLFDKALETSESDISVSIAPLSRISKKNPKKVNASVFEDVFDDSLNLSNVDKSDTSNQKQCFNNIKNKQKHVDSAIFNSSASPEKSNNITTEENKEDSIYVCANTSESSCEKSLKSDNCEMSNQTESKNTSCNSGITSENECDDNCNELIDSTNITHTVENTLNLVEPTDEEKELEQIQEHKQIKSKIADINNQDNSRCSYSKNTDAENNITDQELNESYNNKDNCKVTFNENQQNVKAVGENEIPVEGNVEAFAENKHDGSDSVTDLEESASNFPNSLHSNDKQILEETHDLTNINISHSFNERINVDSVTSNVTANLHNTSGNKKQTKNIVIQELTPTSEGSLKDNLHNISGNNKLMKNISMNEASPIYESEISISNSHQFEKQHSAIEFSSYCEMEKEESLLPIHETTIGDIEIAQKESLFNTQEKTDTVNCLEIVKEESLLSTHEAILTKGKLNIETTVLVEKESSLDKQESSDRVKYVNSVSEESILSTNNKETKTSQFQKERRVSFMLDKNHLNKRASLNKRKSDRKSIIINNSSNSGKLSTSITKQANMNKSIFSLDSLVFEEESENRASGSAFIDLHASKSATGSLNSNSEFSQPSKSSINASEQDRSYLNLKSSNNDYGSQNISEMEQSCTLAREEEPLEDSSEMENNQDVGNILTEEDKLDESTACSTIEEDPSCDENDEQVEEGTLCENEEEGSEVQSLVEEETDDRESLIEDNLLESEVDQFSETMDNSGELNQVENSSYRDGEREEDNSQIKLLQKNLEVESVIMKKNEHSDYNNPLKENKKKDIDVQQLFKNPLPKKTLNKRKIKEILDNIPLSELKKKKRRVSTQSEKSNSSKSREQLLQDEIEEALLKNRNSKQVGFTKANKRKISRKWVTPKMHNFIISKLQPTFGLKARVRAENVVLFLVEHVDSVMKSENNFFDLVEEIKAELAGLEIIHTHWDFYKFATQFFDGTFVCKVFHNEIVNPFEPNDPTESIL